MLCAGCLGIEKGARPPHCVLPRPACASRLSLLPCAARPRQAGRQAGIGGSCWRADRYGRCAAARRSRRTFLNQACRLLLLPTGVACAFRLPVRQVLVPRTSAYHWCSAAASSTPIVYIRCRSTVQAQCVPGSPFYQLPSLAMPFHQRADHSWLRVHTGGVGCDVMMYLLSAPAPFACAPRAWPVPLALAVFGAAAAGAAGSGAGSAFRRRRAFCALL